MATKAVLAMLSGLGALALGGCATNTSPSGRTQLVASADVGAVYSEAGLQAQLALSREAYCSDRECESAAAFRDHVRRLGKRLGDAAHAVAPELGLRPPDFAVSVPTKRDIGTLSSASGSVVVFDGLRQLALPEPALAFLIAREMGHIMGRHHEENTATNIAVSVVVALLFPVAGLVQQGTSAAISSTAAGLSAGVASTALSFAGSHVIKAMYRDEQVREADVYALRIMMRAGWTPAEISEALEAAAPAIAAGDGWLAELRISKARLDQIAMGPALPLRADEAAASAVAAAPAVPTRSEWLHAVSRIAPPFVPEGETFAEGEWTVVGSACGDPAAPVRTVLRRGFVPTPSAFSETLEVYAAKPPVPGRVPPPRVMAAKPAGKKTAAAKLAGNKVAKPAGRQAAGLSKKAAVKKKTIASKAAAAKKRASARPPSAIRAKAAGIDGRRQIGL